MRHSFKALAVTGFILACSAPKLFAPFYGAAGIFVDENGNGYDVLGDLYGTGIITNQLTSFQGPDLSGGVGSPVLIYTLDDYYNGATNGDVALVDVNNSGKISHLLRFLNGYLIFYANDGSRSMADVGLPATFSTNLVQITNQGPAGTLWQPGLNQPGYVGGYISGTTPPDVYTFFSYLSFSTLTNEQLRIRLSSRGIVLLSWPTNLNNLGYALYQNDNLAHDNWSQVTNSPGITNGFSQLPLQATAHSRFFRIMAP
jgi:hypothetical protein